MAHLQNPRDVDGLTVVTLEGPEGFRTKVIDSDQKMLFVVDGDQADDCVKAFIHVYYRGYGEGLAAGRTLQQKVIREVLGIVS